MVKELIDRPTISLEGPFPFLNKRSNFIFGDTYLVVDQKSPEQIQEEQQRKREYFALIGVEDKTLEFRTFTSIEEKLKWLIKIANEKNNLESLIIDTEQSALLQTANRLLEEGGLKDEDLQNLTFIKLGQKGSEFTDSRCIKTGIRTVNIPPFYPAYPVHPTPSI